MKKFRFKDLYHHLGGFVMQSFALLTMLCLPLHIDAKVGDVFTQGNLKYTVLTENGAKGTVSVAAASKSISGELNIPESVENGNVAYSVTVIVDFAFRDCVGLTQLEIPNSVMTIGQYAFCGCSGFTGKLIIPSNVTSIGKCSFERCSGFTGIELPSSITNIEEGVFEDCSSLKGILTIPNSITSIGKFAFSGCQKLSGTLTIPSSVTTIGRDAFHACGFTSLVIPKSITNIELGVFSYCSRLTGTLIIPNSVTTIGQYAFDGCSGLTGIELPSSITNIEEGAFMDCRGLRGTLTIPSSVTLIGDYAFINCENISGTLTIPRSVMTIGEGAFANCSQLTGTLIIPNSVTTIGRNAFLGCYGLTGIELPSSLTSIEYGTFKNCRGLTGTLIIPSSVTTIGRDAFYKTNFNSILIPNSVLDIGVDCFHSENGNAFSNTSHVSLPSHLDKLEAMRNYISTMELTIPFSACNSSLSTFSRFKSVFIMGTDLASSKLDANGKNNNHIYVKPSVYEKYKDNAIYNSLNLSDSIPVTFPANKKYVTLCRDFDVDLRHVNDNLPEGVEPLKAYIVDDADGDLKMVFMDEIKYIPSRLKANVDGYKGMEEYVGVVLKGTPGYTYYYQMGEEDYSKGKDGQMTLEKAMALSGSSAKSTKAMRTEFSSSEKATLVGAAQAMEVKTEETEDGVTFKTYGLKNGQFLEYESDGIIAYNKAYLRIPISQAPSGSNAKVTMYFNNDDGTTDIEHVDLNKDSILGNAAKDAMYNLQGMKVDNTYHGLVIVNGRKYYKK